jgi:hypothetical protein
LAQARRAVVLSELGFIEEIGRPDIDKHLACLVLHHDDRATRDVFLRQRLQVNPQGVFGYPLQVSVDRRRDFARRPHGRELRRPRPQRAADEPTHQVRGSERGRPRGRRQWLAARVFGCLFGQRPHRQHPIDDPIAAGLGELGALANIVQTRSARQTSQQGSLGGGERGQRLVEDRQARGAGPTEPGAEIDALEVRAEDLVFLERRFDAQRERHLEKLSTERLRPRVNRARQLHRQRGCARDDAAVGEARGDRAPQRQDIDPVVRTKPSIFRGDHRVRQRSVQLGVGQGTSAFAIGRPHLAEQAASIVKYPDGRARPLAQLGREGGEQRREEQRGEGRHRDDREASQQPGSPRRHRAHRSRLRANVEVRASRAPRDISAVHRLRVRRRHDEPTDRGGAREIAEMVEAGGQILDEREHAIVVDLPVHERLLERAVEPRHRGRGRALCLDPGAAAASVARSGTIVVGDRLDVRRRVETRIERFESGRQRIIDHDLFLVLARFQKQIDQNQIARGDGILRALGDPRDRGRQVLRRDRAEQLLHVQALVARGFRELFRGIGQDG